VLTTISISFTVGVALSAIAGVAIFAGAAIHLLRQAMMSSTEMLGRSLNRAAGSEVMGEDIGQPRARSL